MEHLVTTDERFLFNFPVSWDEEIQEIFASDPEKLLLQLFENHDQTFLLQKSGFKMDRQLLRWMNKYDECLKDGTPIPEMMEKFINETSQDVIHFYHEYLTGQDIFKIDVELQTDINGQKEVYAPRYNTTLSEVNKKLRLSTGMLEREGALEYGIDTVIEKIKETGPNTCVVLFSPPGWSGLGYNHPDNQAYVYWIDNEGNLRGLTIRTDISLFVSEKLAGVEVENLVSTKERIKNVVRSPIVLQAENFETVLNYIERISQQTFPKQRNEIRNYQKLFTLNSEAEGIVNKLKLDLLSNISHLNKDNIRIFVMLVGKAILDLRKQVLEDKDEKYNKTSISTNYINGYRDQMDMYRYLAIDVEQLKGCNGGGEYLDTRLAMGLFSFIDGGAKHVLNCGSCGVPINAVISSGYQCSSCGDIYLGC